MIEVFTICSKLGTDDVEVYKSQALPPYSETFLFGSRYINIVRTQSTLKILSVKSHV